MLDREVQVVVRLGLLAEQDVHAPTRHRPTPALRPRHARAISEYD